MATPQDVDVWVGLDVGKEEHFADVLDDTGEALFARSIANDEADLDRLRDALTSISPALERAAGSRLAHKGVRDLLAKYPTPTALRSAGRARITRTINARSPRLAGTVARIGRDGGSLPVTPVASNAGAPAVGGAAPELPLLPRQQAYLVTSDPAHTADPASGQGHLAP